MNVRDAYDHWAESYDSDPNLTRDLDAQVAREVVAGVPIEAQARLVLEMGCGTGKNTPFYATLGATVCAFDFSEPMLRRARERAIQMGLPNIAFAIADLTQLWPVRDGVAGLVAFDLVLEHAGDLEPVFAEAARCLAPRGYMFVCELHPFRQYAGSEARPQREGEALEVPVYTHHVSDYVRAAQDAGLALVQPDEWWHPSDRAAEGSSPSPPRLVSFLFTKQA